MQTDTTLPIDPTPESEPTARRSKPSDQGGRLSRPTGAAFGVAAAAVGLAVAEVTTLASSRLRSPVLDVGDRVVDLVPPFVKDLAIAWFGTNDKIALLVGIGVVLLAAAGLAGVLVFGRRRPAGLAVIAGFAVLGSLSVWTARTERPVWAALPSLIGAALAAALLLRLGRWIDDTADRQRSAELSASAIGGRRSFLGVAAAMTGGAVVVGVGARRLDEQLAPAAELGADGLPVPGSPLPELPAEVAFDLDAITPIVTPNDDFYRIDTALTVPRVDPGAWTLRIHGLVDDELVLDLDDLRSREIVEADITLTCVSNLVGGGLVGHARWLGVRLDDLLAEAGIRPQADQIVGRSVDGYTCGFPTSTLDGRNALVAIGMNGEALPRQHGFPARLVVPGLYGYVSATKWLSEIELTTFEAFDHYWVPRGYAAEAPIKIQSRIDLPATLATLPSGATTVAGVAWAQTRGVAGVEVRIDEGPWQPATMAAAINDDSWRQWAIELDLEPGRRTLQSRAIGGDGEVQTDERTDPLPDGASGRHQIVVMVA